MQTFTWADPEGARGADPHHRPPGKLHVAIGFLRNTNTDPSREADNVKDELDMSLEQKGKTYIDIDNGGVTFRYLNDSLWLDYSVIMFD